MEMYRKLKVGEKLHGYDEFFVTVSNSEHKWVKVCEDSSVHPRYITVEGRYRRPLTTPEVKETNPKDAVGIRKWRIFSTIPMTVMWELGVAMMEGARKYGRHNYRVSGVRASVYVDAAMGHITQWWEGEDTDADSGLSHITKAIASLVVLRDAMIQKQIVDDRPPATNVDMVRSDLQAVVDAMFEKYPEPKEAFVGAVWLGDEE
jgi:Domain of unknown function (DUF5664)